MTGETDSTDFPAVNFYQDDLGGAPWDAFVARFRTAGTGVDYSSYINAGEFGATGYAVAVDSSGEPYVVGEAWIVDTDADGYLIKFDF